MKYEMGHGDRPPLDMPEFENVDPLTSWVFQAYRRIMQLQRQALPKMMADHGIHHGEAFCLGILAKREDLSQSDLADMLHLSRPRVTAILKSLENAGSIERRVDENDQRVTRVSITPEGREREKELRSVWGEYLQATIGALSSDDRLELGRTLNLLGDRIAESLQEESGSQQ